MKMQVTIKARQISNPVLSLNWYGADFVKEGNKYYINGKEVFKEGTHFNDNAGYRYTIVNYN